MTNDEFDQLLTALNIYNERGELEYFTGKVWTAWGGPLSGKFRIKPQPREVLVCLACNELVPHPDNAHGHKLTKFREVIE